VESRLNFEDQVESMNSKLAFLSKKMAKFMELKKQRDKIVEIIEKQNQKKELRRKELLKNCKNFLNRKRKQIEKKNMEKQVHGTRRLIRQTGHRGGEGGGEEREGGRRGQGARDAE
jgi:hypothetical protein